MARPAHDRERYLRIVLHLCEKAGRQAWQDTMVAATTGTRLALLWNRCELQFGALAAAVVAAAAAFTRYGQIPKRCHRFSTEPNRCLMDSDL